MALPTTPPPKFKTKRVHYMALVLGGLLIFERQYVAPVLIAIFLVWMYTWEKVLHGHGRSADYWKFQAKYLYQKMILARWELIEWRKNKVEKDKLRKAMEDKREGRKGQMSFCEDEDAKRIGALEVAPKEIWMKILNDLKDPTDVMSCYYTCELFRNLLETRMKAEAFSVLDNYLEKYADNQWGLQNDDILNCRLLSISWKLSVDNFLQHNPSQMNFLGHCYPTTVIDSNDIRHVEGLIQRLVSNYHQGNSNPFPSRHVQLRIHADLSEDERKIFVTAVSILLKYFGKHIWYLTFYMSMETHPLASYQTVYDFLGQTPNVKMVDLCFHGYSKDNPSGQEIRELDNFLLSGSFPKLNALVAMKFDGVPDSFINAALKANSHIEKLDVTPKAGSTHEWIKFNGSTQDLPLLQDCSISCIRIPQLTELQHVNWPLTRLTVELGESRNENMDLGQLLKTFEKFDPTLKYLNFGANGRSMTMAHVELSHLEELEVHFTRKVLLDFIISLRSLKRLKVHIYNERLYNDEHELEIIKFKDAVKHLHKQDETNIWRLFPELVNVTIEMVKEERGTRKGRTYIYSRHGDEVTKTLKIN